ncbi:MAG: ribosomal RNA small subunit methyltransferase A [Candidatus Diapherotrites archaeon]|nr:ribosomal RNA small subunit methyltransferase A [Candidatus Diapherotrites archaeon]
MTLLVELNALMAQHAFKPVKKFGQHFLIEEKVIQEIVRTADLNAQDIVLEVGSGTGFLTAALLNHCKVIGIELDNALCNVLNEKFSPEIARNQFTLLRGNALEVEWPSFTKLVGAPPYSISTELVFKLLEREFKCAVLLMQKEFADRVLAFEGLKDYNALSASTQYYCNGMEISRVKPTAFFPRPPMESQLIRLDRKREKLLPPKEFIPFLKTIFRYKNKTLQNALLQSKSFLSRQGFAWASLKDFDEKAKRVPGAREKVFALPASQIARAFTEIKNP